MQNSSHYTFQIHKHHFAAWGASLAASTSTSRFKVRVGRAIVESVGLPALFGGVLALPRPEQMDHFHRDLRRDVIGAAAGFGLDFSHGIAAKLINMYFKGYLLDQANCLHPSVSAMHPPIDSVMLKALVESGKGDTALWRKLGLVRWTKFTSGHYEEAVAELRRMLGPQVPLWMAEEYWGGFQGAAD